MTKKKPKAELQKRGPEPLMDEVMMGKIKDLFFEGKTLPQMAKSLEISDRTIQRYKNNNTGNLSENLANWKRLQTLEKAESNLNEIANIKVDKNNTPLLKIIGDKSQYLTETLGKAYYSKSIEHTGTIKHEQTLLTDEQKDIMLELLQEQKRLKESSDTKTLEIIDVECE